MSLKSKSHRDSPLTLAMKAKGISAHELAIYLNVAISSVRRWIAGDLPNKDYLRKLSLAFDRDLETEIKQYREEIYRQASKNLESIW